MYILLVTDGANGTPSRIPSQGPILDVVMWVCHVPLGLLRQDGLFETMTDGFRLVTARVNSSVFADTASGLVR